MAWEMTLDQSVLEDLYTWIDSLTLSRPKKRIERDFSDGSIDLVGLSFIRSLLVQGQLVAEVVHFYFPGFVDLHNYSAANSLQHKKSNWNILNEKVLSNFGLDLPDVIITGLSNGKPGLIEVLLYNLRLKIDELLELKEKRSSNAATTDESSRRDTSNSFRSDKSSRNNVLNVSTKKLPLSKNYSLMDFEQIKQEYFQQEEQIEILQAKLRRLEHVLQLKDQRIEQLNGILHHQKQ